MILPHATEAPICYEYIFKLPICLLSSDSNHSAGLVVYLLSENIWQVFMGATQIVHCAAYTTGAF